MHIGRLKFAVFAALMSVICVSAVVAEYSPPDGGEDVYQLLAPHQLSRGFSVTSLSAPSAHSMNPAAGGLLQRTTLDVSYTGITGFGDRDDDAGWQGHIGNLAISHPNPYGVITGSGHFLSNQVADMKWGNTGLLRGSFATELYPEFLVGAGLWAAAGGNRSDPTAAIAGDLGMIYLIGDRGLFRDLRWGAALKNIGSFYRPVRGRDALPGPFTPATGFAFSLIRTGNLDWDANFDISAPSFQNLRLNLGTGLGIAGRVDISMGYQVDLQQVINSDRVEQRSVLPSFGIGVRIVPGEDPPAPGSRRAGEVNVRTAAAPLYGDLWGFSSGVTVPLGGLDTEGPVIETDYTEPIYISPNNSGVQDDLRLALRITDESPIAGYTVRIRNEDGDLARTLGHIEPRPEQINIGDAWQRLRTPRTGISVPEQLRWDGRSDAGGTVTDGRYTLQIEAWDEHDNSSVSDTKVVYVDTAPPQLSLELPERERRVFRLAEDGENYEFSIEQSGSSEDLWEAHFENAAGETVRTYTWTNAAPETIVWNARGDDGELVADGVYRYKIESTDRSGNHTVKSVDSIILNTTPTPASLTVDHGHFSPNDNGRRDTVTISIDLPVRTALERWSLQIANDAGEVVRAFEGVDEVPAHVVFYGRDERGQLLPEGRYQATLTAEYRNGHRPTAHTPVMTLDLTPPTASIRTETPVFSPDGDGVLDSAIFFQETTREELWVGRIVGDEGETIRTLSWRESAPLRFEWDGKKDSGVLAPDGVYYYELESTDRAGNYGVSNRVQVRLDTAATPVLITAEYDAFSPNASGVRDTIALFPKLERNADMVRYDLEIIDAETETVLRRFSGEESMAERYRWDGRDREGRIAPDAMYIARLEILYTHGNLEKAITEPFELDTVYPKATVEIPDKLFSPDGDGHKDTILVSQSSDPEELWEGRIENAAGETVRTLYWNEELEDFEWDGADDEGNLVPDGFYRYMVETSDRAGNRTEVTIDGIEIDTRPTPIFVTAEYSGFSPNDNGFRDTIELSTFTNLTEGVKEWSLEIEHEDGRVVQRFAGGELSDSESFIWDGRAEDGKIYEGWYRAHYRVVYHKGNRPEAGTSRFLLDSQAPEVNLALDPVPFSPDADGVDDELFISIEVNNLSEIAYWQFDILDRNRNFFNEFSGRGMPPVELIWDGRAIDGDLVISAEDYPYELEVVDVLGNRATVEGVIPIDILVIRDGDRYRVAIANVTFGPDSPELIIDETDEKGVRNVAILDRLVEIFERYRDYEVQIEGHAVNVTGTEREEREELQPLSLARAEAVKAELVERGLGSHRFTTVGRGGTIPLVPHDDLDERWKNRRVEFILDR